MKVSVRDPLSKLRVTVGLHNGSHETWLQYDAVIDEYAREGVTKIPELRREIEDAGSVALQAAQAIGRMGVEGWPTIRDLLTHPDSSVRHCAILGGVVEYWGGWRWDEETLEECAEILSRMLQEDTPEIRSAVLRSMGEFVDVAFARPLFPGLIDLAETDGALGQEARVTLINIVNPDHLDYLTDDPAEAARLHSAYERANARETSADNGGKR